MATQSHSSRSYRLLAADGTTMLSSTPGELGGYAPLRIYGRLDCPSALRHLAKGAYAEHRVFFADEDAAIAAGFRPCAKCLGARYRQWRTGGDPGSAEYPWLKAHRPRRKEARA